MHLTFNIVFLVLCASFSALYGARVCVINTGTCSSTTNVCGRYGRSNLCQRFNNSCALGLANCQSSIQYTSVNTTFCTNIAVNQRRNCNGLSTSTGGLSSLLSSLFGSSSSSTTATVTPIIIRRG